MHKVRENEYECEVCLFVIMFVYIVFSSSISVLHSFFFHNNCKTIVGCASTHNGYVTEQINGVTQMGPEIEKKKVYFAINMLSQYFPS